MAVQNNTIVTTNFVKAQGIDFVNTFTGSLKKLIEVMGVTEQIPVPAGMHSKTYTKRTTMANGKVAEGDIIPLSKVEFTEGDPIVLELLTIWRKK